MLNFIKQLLGLPTRLPIAKEDLERGTVIDVRSPAEFQGGHFSGSINIPLDQVPNQLDKIKSLPRPIITCCKSGMRSSMANKMLKKGGIEALNGGSWYDVERVKNS